MSKDLETLEVTNMFNILHIIADFIGYLVLSCISIFILIHVIVIVMVGIDELKRR
jgi:hypothetical protein